MALWDNDPIIVGNNNKQNLWDNDPILQSSIPPQNNLLQPLIQDQPQASTIPVPEYSWLDETGKDLQKGYISAKQDFTSMSDLNNYLDFAEHPGVSV